VLRVAAPVGFACVFLLQPRRVGQDEPAQIGRTRRAEDAPAKALRHEPGQIATVIEVRVRQHDRVN
jgi:hypothetical protein